MDAALAVFYSSVGNTSVLDIELFDRSTFDFLSASGSDPARVDAYFNAFLPLWSIAMDRGDQRGAFNVLKWALRPVLAWEGANRAVHKGTAFYFQAMSALDCGDLDHGYHLMHAALNEDVRKHHAPDEYPDTPTTKFVVLSKKPGQAAQHWVAWHADRLEARLLRSPAGIPLDEFRTRLLERWDVRESTFLFSFVFARIEHVDQKLTNVGGTLFTGVYRASLLLDLCIVVESLLRRSNSDLKDAKGFFQPAWRLSERSQLKLTQFDLQERFRALFASDFDGTLASALDGKLLREDGTPIVGLEQSALVTYNFRNSAAHSAGASDVVKARYAEIADRVFDALFLTVKTFY